MERTLVQKLDELHDSYVEAVNLAIGNGEMARAVSLAADYDHDAVQMIAEHEGKSHLLPHLWPEEYDTPLRRLVRQLSRKAA